jgi:hypothetical protein
VAAYNGVNKRFKNALMGLMTGLTYDIGNGPGQAFVTVTGDATTEFDSYPIVRVLPGEMDTQKASVAENERTLAYDCYVHLPLENRPTHTVNGQPLAMSEGDIVDWMYDLTDIILDALDEGDYHNVLSTYDSTLPSYFLEAQKGHYTVVGSKGGALLQCVVSLHLRYSKLL